MENVNRETAKPGTLLGVPRTQKGGVTHLAAGRNEMSWHRQKLKGGCLVSRTPPLAPAPSSKGAHPPR